MEKIKKQELERISQKIEQTAKDLSELASLLRRDERPDSPVHQYVRDRVSEERETEILGFLDVLLAGIHHFDEEEKTLHKGIVYTAAPLSPEIIVEMEAQTEALIKRPVQLENILDPSIIGGFLISIDDKLIDATIKKRLEDLRTHLTEEK